MIFFKGSRVEKIHISEVEEGLNKSLMLLPYVQDLQEWRRSGETGR